MLDELKIFQLRDQSVSSTITSSSTLYVPPCTADFILVPENTSTFFGLPPPKSVVRSNQVYPGFKVTKAQQSSPCYAEYETAAIQNLANYVTPADQLYLRASTGVRAFMTELALKPGLLDRYVQDPVEVTAQASNLCPEERFAFGLAKPAPVHALMRGTADAIRRGPATYSELECTDDGKDNPNGYEHCCPPERHPWPGKPWPGTAPVAVEPQSDQPIQPKGSEPTITLPEVASQALDNSHDTVIDSHLFHGATRAVHGTQRIKAADNLLSTLDRPVSTAVF